MLPEVSLFLAMTFLGYTVGRFADNYLNFWIGDPAWAPDHWTYGLALMIATPVFSSYIAIGVFSFGLGHLISDLKDFLNFKVFGKDNKEKSRVKFWHID